MRHSGDFPQVILIVPSHVPNIMVVIDHFVALLSRVRSIWLVKICTTASAFCKIYLILRRHTRPGVISDDANSASTNNEHTWSFGQLHNPWNKAIYFKR